MVEFCGVTPAPALGPSAHPVQAVTHRALGVARHAARHAHHATHTVPASPPPGQACMVGSRRLADLKAAPSTGAAGATVAKGPLAAALATAGGQAALRLAGLAALGGGVVGVAGDQNGVWPAGWLGSQPVLGHDLHAEGDPGGALPPAGFDPVSSFGAVPPGWPADPAGVLIPALPAQSPLTAVPEPPAASIFALAAVVVVALRLGRASARRGIRFRFAPDYKNFHRMTQILR